MIANCIFIANNSLGRQQTPNPVDTSQYGTWKPCITPHKGKLSVRNADSCAGLGSWKKRKLHGNNADMGLKVTRPEKEPTSKWSYFAR